MRNASPFGSHPGERDCRFSRHEVEWPTQAILDQIATGKTRTVRLKQPIPVLILYWTAAVSRDGRTYFLPDVYGRDAAIIRGLNGELTLPKLKPRTTT